MDKLACMKAFTAVASAGGFSSAARKTSQTKALLSKYVAQLEASLNVRLFYRTTRQVSLTEVGKIYFNQCKPLIEELEALDTMVKNTHSIPKGELTISAPMSFSELHLMPAISEFGKQYPDIIINMVLTDRLVNIVEEGFDLAIRIGVLADSNLIARRLTNIHSVVCASPDYLKENGEPLQPDDLLHHTCIVDSNYRYGKFWDFKYNDTVKNVEIKGRYIVNNAVAVKELALAGNGIALCPNFVAYQAIRDNRLNIVLPKYKINMLGLYAVYAHRRFVSKKLQLFIAFLERYFSKKLVWNE